MGNDQQCHAMSMHDAGLPNCQQCQVVNIDVIVFAWIPDSGSMFKVRSHNYLAKKSKAGVIQSTK